MLPLSAPLRRRGSRPRRAGLHRMWALCGLLAAGAGAQTPTVLTPAALPPEALAALQRARVPTEAVAVVVEEVGHKAAPGSPRLSLNARQPMNPASLVKLVTTYAGLDLLGPAYAWRTPVWVQGRVHDGVLDGSVLLRGSGDPKFSVDRAWQLVRRLQQSGVREIRGDIVLDRRLFAPAEASPDAFDGEPLRPHNVQADALLLNLRSVLYTFTPDPARGVATVTVDPPLAGLAVDATVPLTGQRCDDWRTALKATLDNATRVRFAGSYPSACGERTWPVAFPEPSTYEARLLGALWHEAGGRLTGTVRDGPAPDTTPPSFELTSPSLSEVVRDINKFSNNVMAQQLFLTLAAQQRAPATPQDAREMLARWLHERTGEPLDDISLDNGSGLSRKTRMTAQVLARLLQDAWVSPAMPELMASLPVSGLDGTLRRSRAPAGRAHLKTGSLRDVAGVAGFVLGHSGRRYVLVAMINHPNAAAARAALDSVVQWTIEDQLQR